MPVIRALAHGQRNSGKSPLWRGVPAKRAGCVNLSVTGIIYNIIIYKDLLVIESNPAQKCRNNLALIGGRPYIISVDKYSSSVGAHPRARPHFLSKLLLFLGLKIGARSSAYLISCPRSNLRGILFY